MGMFDWLVLQMPIRDFPDNYIIYLIFKAGSLIKIKRWSIVQEKFT